MVAIEGHIKLPLPVFLGRSLVYAIREYILLEKRSMRDLTAETSLVPGLRTVNVWMSNMQFQRWFVTDFLPNPLGVHTL